MFMSLLAARQTSIQQEGEFVPGVTAPAEG